MKRFILGIALVTLGLVAGTVMSSYLDRDNAEAQNKKKPAFTEVVIGEVPNEFGKLASVSGTSNNALLCFQNDKGEVRLLEFRGNKLTPRAFKVNRKY